MRSAIHFVHPGDLATATGGYAYARELIAACRLAGRPLTVHRLPDGFPRPGAAALAVADAMWRALPDGAVVVVDGLAYGALPDVAAAHAGRLVLIALVHHPLALETGLASAEAARLRDDERRALSHARLVVVTSAATAAALRQDYGVPGERISVVEPGTARAVARADGGSAPAAGSDGAFESPRSTVSTGASLLCVATLTPRKGHAVLLDALAGLPASVPPWRLRCIGSARRDPAHAARLAARVAALGLGDRVTFTGEVDAATLAAAYRAADAFVLASHHEGYGMVLAEAMAHGLPIVATAAGASGATVADGAGLLVPPGDVDALRQALARVLAEPDLRARLAAGARRAAALLPDWRTAAARFLQAVDAVATRAAAGGAGSGTADAASEGEGSGEGESKGVGESKNEGEGARPAGFSPAWLALREPYDHAARAVGLTQRLAAAVAARPGTGSTAIDLGCGSGSNLRFLGPRLAGIARWLAVDHDPALLASLPRDGRAPMPCLEPVLLDLARDLDPLPWARCALVTGSALLDLVSDDWLARLVDAAAPHRPALLFVLNYDGRMRWTPALPDDPFVLAAFNAHQRTDKGFGPALGPTATAAAATRLGGAGYRVLTAASPWRFGSADTAIQHALVTGIADALAGATEATASPAGLARLAAWRERRLAAITMGRSTLEVGHRDLLALPADPGPTERRRPSAPGGTAAGDSPRGA